jgi:hypothetical protein
MKNVQNKKPAKKSPATAATTKVPTAITGMHGDPTEPPATHGTDKVDVQRFVDLIDHIMEAAIGSTLNQEDIAHCLFSAGYLMLGSVLYCDGCTQRILDEAKEFVMARRDELAKKESSAKKN